MKTVEDVLGEAASRLKRRCWQHVAAGSGWWPHVITIGNPRSQDVVANWPATAAWAQQWRQWAGGHPAAPVTWANRKIDRTLQQLPRSLTLATPEQAAAVVGPPWPGILSTARQRWTRLHRDFPATASAALLKATADLSELDFTVLLETATWLRGRNHRHLTARQVPVPGLHAKWIDANHHLVGRLLGSRLQLQQRPSTMHFTYLDPGHLAAGRRRYDSYTLNDTSQPAYQPAVAIITENKDTALFFPDLPGGVAIHGGGDYSAAALPMLPWLSAVPHLLYWGDIDGDGYEIVDLLRSRGLHVTTILMDIDTLDRYRKWGTRTDRKGRPIQPPVRDLPNLTPVESAVYDQLKDPAWSGPLRLEQERIPLPNALEHVAAVIRGESPHSASRPGLPIVGGPGGEGNHVR